MQFVHQLLFVQVAILIILFIQMHAAVLFIFLFKKLAQLAAQFVHQVLPILALHVKLDMFKLQLIAVLQPHLICKEQHVRLIAIRDFNLKVMYVQVSIYFIK